MGVESSGGDSSSSSSSSNNNETEVILNIYDLTTINNYVAWFGFGIFHSGIEGTMLKPIFFNQSMVWNMDLELTSIPLVEYLKWNQRAVQCPGFIYRCSVPLGRIDIPPSEFRQFIETLASEYHGDTYHLISKNCNHFTDDMSTRLTGKNIPGWVNRLAKLGAFCNCLLPESLQETTIKQMPEYHSYAEEDVSGSPSINTPQELTESEDSDKDNKQLLSPLSRNGEVAFIKEAQR